MMQCVATVLIVLCGSLAFSHAKENQCLGGNASCPDDSTCCSLSDGSFGCCPTQNSVCCGDSAYCCPDGYICDVIKGICKMGRKLIVPLLKKLPAKPTLVCLSLSIFSVNCRLYLYKPSGYRSICLLAKKKPDISPPSFTLLSINLLASCQDICILGND